MARMILNSTVGTAAPSFSKSLDPNVELAAQATHITATKTATALCVTDAAPVAAAVAVLVADGATPTQAHVTTLNTAWGTLNTDITAADTAAAVPSLTAATAAVAKDVVLVVNGATVLTKNALKQIMDALYRLVADGTNLLT